MPCRALRTELVVDLKSAQPDELILVAPLGFNFTSILGACDGRFPSFSLTQNSGKCISLHINKLFLIWDSQDLDLVWVYILETGWPKLLGHQGYLECKGPARLLIIRWARQGDWSFPDTASSVSQIASLVCVTFWINNLDQLRSVILLPVLQSMLPRAAHSTILTPGRHVPLRNCLVASWSLGAMWPGRGSDIAPCAQ